MARDSLDVRGSDALASEARQERVAQIVEPEWLSVGERRNLIADRGPPKRTREVGAVERPTELASEDVVASERPRRIEPRSQLFEYRHLAGLAALRRSLDESAVPVRRERPTNSEVVLMLVEVVPPQTYELAEPKAGEGETSQCPLAEWVEARQGEHALHLEVVESARRPFGIARFAATVGERPARVRREQSVHDSELEDLR